MLTAKMLESVKKVEATRGERMGMEPRRMTAEEKDALLKNFIPTTALPALIRSGWGRTRGRRRPWNW